jgi:hypothetical protein
MQGKWRNPCDLTNNTSFLSESMLSLNANAEAKEN